MSYNLTAKQRDDLKWVVDQIRAGFLDESFAVEWSFGGRIMNGWISKSPDNETTLKQGTLDAWHNSNMIIAKEITHTTSNHTWHSTRCTITQLAYDAVDSNFVEPEGQPNENRLREFLSHKDFFNHEMLRTLATQIGFDHETIPGLDKSAYARELVVKARRNGSLWKLVYAAFKVE